MSLPKPPGQTQHPLLGPQQAIVEQLYPSLVYPSRLGFTFGGVSNGGMVLGATISAPASAACVERSGGVTIPGSGDDESVVG